MKYIFSCVIFFFLSCNGETLNSDVNSVFVKHHYSIADGGSPAKPAYSHFVYVSADNLNDSTYMIIAKKYKDTVSFDLPICSICFISDTSDFPQSLDDLTGEQMFKYLIQEFIYNYDDESKDFGKLMRIGYYKNGKLYRGVDIK